MKWHEVSDPFLAEKYRVTVEELADHLGVCKTTIVNARTRLKIKGKRALTTYGGRREEFTTCQAQKIIDYVRGRQCKSN